MTIETIIASTPPPPTVEWYRASWRDGYPHITILMRKGVSCNDSSVLEYRNQLLSELTKYYSGFSVDIQ
jgi:hypothetical protein